VQQLEAWLAGSGGLPPTGGSGPDAHSPSGAGGGVGSSRRNPRASNSKAAATLVAPMPPPPSLAADDDEPEPQTESEDENPYENEPETASPPEEAADLTSIAKADPGVILATRILGGEVVAVRPDGEGS
jgi:hypothetical protein